MLSALSLFQPSSSALARTAQYARPLSRLLSTSHSGMRLGAERAMTVAFRRFASSSSPAERESDGYTHFRASGLAHPLKAKPDNLSRASYDNHERQISDHVGRQQNHIWSPEELEQKLQTFNDKHVPITVTDHVMYNLMYSLYHTFNFISGYKHVDPTPRSIEWRLIILESVAGVPGFVAAGFRHFRSLRMLRKDYGWIGTLLEEAENERMHLLVCLRMFEASFVTRSLVIAAQFAMTPALMLTYLVQPKALHRFVGYLEQTACVTYHNVITHIETPGTQLHQEWADLPAPDIAKGYWHLPDNAKWVDALKCMYADEANHRDVNHTFASMESDDPNPYVLKHREDALRAWKLIQEEEAANAGSEKAATTR